MYAWQRTEPEGYRKSRPHTKPGAPLPIAPRGARLCARLVTPRVSGAALLALLLPAHSGACTGFHIATSSIPSLRNPSELVAFDFDGDGERDVVSLHRDSATLGVHRVGRDLDVHASSFRLEGIPGQLAPLRDGFVVAFPAEAIVAVVRRDSAGAVVHRGSASALAVGDLDRNGTEDIAIASDRLLLVFQRDDGSFDPPVGLPLDPRPRTAPTLCLRDLDDDGTIDVIVGMTTGEFDDAIPDHLRAFRNASHGRLADETWYRVPWPERVHAGDLDGDDRADAIAFGRDGAWASFGLGHGWLGPAHRILAARVIDGLLVDLDGDARDDIVAIDDRRDALVLVRSVGPRRFAPPARVDIGRAPTRIVALPRAHDVLLVAAHADGLTALRIASR
jgi:hypothetical protein